MKERTKAHIKARLMVTFHPGELRKLIEADKYHTPWYATARPFAIIQHWAFNPMLPVTYCGKVAGERSTGEIRTLIGWHCRKCHRRAKRAKRAAESK